MNELDIFIAKVERGLTGMEDAEWFRDWLSKRRAYRMDIATAVLTIAGIITLIVLAASEC